MDPVEPSKMLEAAAREGATVTCVLTTHKHPCVSILAVGLLSRAMCLAGLHVHRPWLWLQHQPQRASCSDHAGGNVSISQQLPDLLVVGGSEDAVPACTRPVDDGDVLQLGDISIRCIHTP